MSWKMEQIALRAIDKLINTLSSLNKTDFLLYKYIYGQIKK